MFAGVKRLFLFRLKRKERERVKQNMVQQVALFRNLLVEDKDDLFEYMWLEEAAWKKNGGLPEHFPCQYV
jgi:hypothetical protein